MIVNVNWDIIEDNADDNGIKLALSTTSCDIIGKNYNVIDINYQPPQS